LLDIHRRVDGLTVLLSTTPNGEVRRNLQWAEARLKEATYWADQAMLSARQECLEIAREIAEGGDARQVAVNVAAEATEQQEG
jgi:hypothetical protein